MQNRGCLQWEGVSREAGGQIGGFLGHSGGTDSRKEDPDGPRWEGLKLGGSADADGHIHLGRNDAHVGHKDDPLQVFIQNYMAYRKGSSEDQDLLRKPCLHFIEGFHGGVQDLSF